MPGVEAPHGPVVEHGSEKVVWPQMHTGPLCGHRARDDGRKQSLSSMNIQTWVSMSFFRSQQITQ